MFKWITTLTLGAVVALGLTSTPSDAGSFQHSAQASHHGSQASAHSSAAVVEGAATVLSVPVIVVGSGIALSGHALAEIGEGTVAIGVDALEAVHAPHVIEPFPLTPGPAPFID